MRGFDRRPERDLVRRDPGFEAALARGGRDLLSRERRRASVKARHAGEPGGHCIGVALQPLPACCLGRKLALEDAGHDLALAVQRELEVLQQAPDVRAFLEVAGAHVGVDRRAAVVGAEARVAAGEVAHVEARVHRVRLPAEEHDRPLRGDGALDLRQHALLARLDELEAAEPELVLLDQREHEPIAVVARLDAVDLVVELFRKALDVREIAQARLVQVGRHGQRVLGAVEVCAHDFDRSLGLVGREVRRHGGHPVAEEHVDVAVLERGESHRHREHGDPWLVAEQAHEMACKPGRRRDVGPADVREAHDAAGFGLGSGPRGAGQRHQQQGAYGDDTFSAHVRFPPQPALVSQNSPWLTNCS